MDTENFLDLKCFNTIIILTVIISHQLSIYIYIWSYYSCTQNHNNKQGTSVYISFYLFTEHLIQVFLYIISYTWALNNRSSYNLNNIIPGSRSEFCFYPLFYDFIYHLVI